MVQQVAARNRAEQTQRAVRHAENERDMLIREVQILQRTGAAGIVQPGENVVLPEAPGQEGDQELYDSSSLLARGL